MQARELAICVAALSVDAIVAKPFGSGGSDGSRVR